MHGIQPQTGGLGGLRIKVRREAHRSLREKIYYLTTALSFQGGLPGTRGSFFSSPGTTLIKTHSPGETVPGPFQKGRAPESAHMGGGMPTMKGLTTQSPSKEGVDGWENPEKKGTEW